MNSTRLTSNPPVWTTTLPRTPIGPLAVAVSERGLAGVGFGPCEQMTTWPVGQVSRSRLLDQAVTELEEYFAGKRRVFEIALDWGPLGSFQRQVLAATAAIPFGQVRRYGQLAADLAHPGAARAVGGFMAGNQLPIVVPCHRVVGSDGRLRGFAAGLAAKCWLLELEGHRVINNRLIIEKDGSNEF